MNVLCVSFVYVFHLIKLLIFVATGLFLANKVIQMIPAFYISTFGKTYVYRFRYQ